MISDTAYISHTHTHTHKKDIWTEDGNIPYKPYGVRDTSLLFG